MLYVKSQVLNTNLGFFNLPLKKNPITAELAMAIEVKLSRPSRIYRPGVSPSSISSLISLFLKFDPKILYQESIEGKIITNSSSSISYHKILVTATGTVNLQVILQNNPLAYVLFTQPNVGD